MPTVLHLLSQRPLLTGSGITLDALVRHTAANRWEQHVVVGTSRSDPDPSVGGLPAHRIQPLVFDTDDLPFPVPGMSDVMPYESTVFSRMKVEQWTAYTAAWRRHLEIVVGQSTPDIIHAHHLWLLGSLVKDVAPQTPVVSHCHATGLRQMDLCPEQAPAIVDGLRRNDAFAVLHEDQGILLRDRLGLPEDRIHIVGAGYRADLFHPSPPGDTHGHILYAGKLSLAKGLPPLLDAFESLAQSHPDARLHIAGSGSGEKAAALEDRIESSAPAVVFHGRLEQQQLADLMRRCHAFVLPSFYEGLPLVLVEAMACGCRLIATALDGVASLVPHLGDALTLIPPPRLENGDHPYPEDLPRFCSDLEHALAQVMTLPPLDPDPAALTQFTWSAVHERVESIWHSLLP